MKRLIRIVPLVAVLFSVACGLSLQIPPSTPPGGTPPVVTPDTPPVPDIAVLTVHVTPSAAVVQVGDRKWTTREDATIVEEFAAGTYAVTVTAPGYIPLHFDITLKAGERRRAEAALVPLPVADWCSTKTEDQLRNIRMDLGGVRLSVSTSPTRGHYLFTPTYMSFDADMRALIRREYKARGYTHFSVGPIVERGYPGWRGHDFRANPEQWVALLEELWRDDLIPVVWLMPDWVYNDVDNSPGNRHNPINWAKVEAELTPILQRADMQRVHCVTVAGWEVTDNEWVKTIAKATDLLSWQARVAPRAYRYWHASVDNGASCNYEIDGEGCEGKAWRAKAPYIHGQFHQTGAPGGWNLAAGRDPANPQHRVDQFLDNIRYEVMRFHTGHYVPGGVRGADGKLLDVIAGEYSAYFELNDGESEEWGRSWGALAMTVPGVRGFGDGGPGLAAGRVPSPPVPSLTMCGRHFCDAGRVWIPRLKSGLTLLTRPDAEQERFLDRLVEAGFNGFRVFAGALTWAGQTPDGARAALPALLDRAAARGLVVEVTALTDTGTEYDMRAHVAGIVDIVRGRRHVLLEVANELGHHTQSPSLTLDNARQLGRELAAPAGILWAVGAPLGMDEPCPPDPWIVDGSVRERPAVCAGYAEHEYPGRGGDYATAHLDRGRDLWNQVRRVREMAYEPALNNEPIGCDEPGFGSRQRYEDPAFAFALGALDRGFGVGGVHHSQSGLVATAPGPVQQACEAAYVAAHRAIDAVLPGVVGQYRNVGHDGSPIASAKFVEGGGADGVVRAYSFVGGDRGVTIVLGGKGDTGFVWAHGWRQVRVVDSRTAHDGRYVSVLEIRR